MPRTPRLRLPAALTDALRRRRVAVIAGAGISIWEPSSLPSWSAFNEILLDEVKALAIRVAPSGLVPAITGLILKDIGSTNFSYALVNDLTGDAYFRILATLDACETNPCHRALATLASHGVLRAIVTTNFDTLIERAFEKKGVPLKVLATPVDYLRPEFAHCTLFKIHGTASRRGGLVDTMGQKLRGLHQVVRARLARIFMNHHVLVLGFSGDDLEFGADYLGLNAIGVASPGITWVVRPSTKPSAPVQRVLSRARTRGRPLTADLSRVLERLGLGKVSLRRSETDALRTQAHLRRASREVLAAQGPLNALAFCMRLLSATGQTESATQAWRHIAGRLETSKKRERFGSAFRALAAEAPLLVGLFEQNHWGIAELRRIESMLKHGGSKRSRSGKYSTLYHAEATAWLFVAEAHIRMEKFDEAGVSMEAAMDHAEWLGDPGLLAAVYSIYGRRAAVLDPRMLEDDEEALAWLMAAEGAGLVGGNLEAANAALDRGDMLIRVGEYDSAVECIRRVRARFNLGLHRELRLRVEEQRGRIQLRQGRASTALGTWMRSVERAGNNLASVARIEATIINHLGFSPVHRPRVIALCDKMISAISAGQLPADGRLEGVNTLSYYQDARDFLAAQGDTGFAPFFLRRLESPRDRAEEARQNLMRAEYARNTKHVLRNLNLLVAVMHSQGRRERTLECALAHQRRAQRQGTAEDRFQAAANVAMARYWLGDRSRAAQQYARLYRHPLARRKRWWAGLGRRLPAAMWPKLPPERAVVPYVSMPSRFHNLDVFDAVILRRVKPLLPTLEKLAQEALEATEFGIARVYIFELIGGYRELRDRQGEARGYRMLAQAASTENRFHQASALEERAAELCKPTRAGL